MTAAFAASPGYRLLNQQSALEQGLFGPDVVIEEGRVLAPSGGEKALASADWTAHGRRVSAGALKETWMLTTPPSGEGLNPEGGEAPLCSFPPA